MNEQKKEQPKRHYLVTDAQGVERLVEATSPATAVQQVYATHVKVASTADVVRLLTAAKE